MQRCMSLQRARGLGGQTDVEDALPARCPTRSRGVIRGGFGGGGSSPMSRSAVVFVAAFSGSRPWPRRLGPMGWLGRAEGAAEPLAEPSGPRAAGRAAPEQPHDGPKPKKRGSRPRACADETFSGLCLTVPTVPTCSRRERRRKGDPSGGAALSVSLYCILPACSASNNPCCRRVAGSATRTGAGARSRAGDGTRFLETGEGRIEGTAAAGSCQEGGGGGGAGNRSAARRARDMSSLCHASRSVGTHTDRHLSAARAGNG